MARVLQPLTREAINYTWRQLARCVGVAPESDEMSVNGFEKVGVSVHYGKPGHGTRDSPAVIVFPTNAAGWYKLLQARPLRLTWVPVEQMLPRGGSCSVRGELPVLFWSDGCPDVNGPIVQRQGGKSVVFYVDLIATVFFMLSRWEETVVPTRDEHGRFPATASVAYKQGFLDRPIVDEYAMILRAWLKVLYPRWEPQPRRFQVQLSHDIDHIQRFPHWRKGARTLAGDLLKRRDLERAKANGIDTLARIVNPRWDRYYRGIYDLVETSKAYGLGNDVFYFMAAKPGPLDEGYDINSPLVRGCVENLVKEGFEIGLHPSYQAFDQPSQIAEEKERLDAVLGHSEYGGRYHYLRFQSPESWRYMEQAGFTYDATMAYAEQPGFRCGTCHPFRPFDFKAGRELDIIERPLIAMEKTFQNYLKISPDQTVDEVLQLAHRCQQVEGNFSLLWHNGGKRDEWAPSSNTYKHIVKSLADI